MKRTEVKVPEGYRLLLEGEVIRKGDVFLPTDINMGWQAVYDADNDDVQRFYNSTRCKPHARKVQ